MSAVSMATYILVCVSGLAYLGFFIVVTIGGFFDLCYLFKSIKEESLDYEDDGRVATTRE